MSEWSVNNLPSVETEKPVSEYKTEITFRKQNFLFDFAKFYAERNTHVVAGLAVGSPSGQRVEQITYPNFTILESEDPAALISNVHSYEGVRDLFGLKPYQVAALIPKVRLFKVNFFEEDPEKKDKELIFMDRINDKAYIPMLRPQATRGGGVGLKKFEYVFDGKNPAETHMIRCNFEFFFNNFQDLTALQDDGASFIDLIKYSNKRKLEAANADGSVAKSFNPDYFTIKAVLGWSVGTRQGEEDIIPRRLREQIESQLITLQLTLVKHEFDFGQDGTFRLKVYYYGMLEAGMSSPTTDIFLDERVIALQEHLENIKAESKQVHKTLTDLEDKEIELLKKNKKDATRTDAYHSLRARQNKDEASRLYNDVYDNRAVKLDKARVELEAKLREDKISKYKRLLNPILEDKRIFRIELNSAQIEYYKNFMKIPYKDSYQNMTAQDLIARGLVTIADIDPNSEFAVIARTLQAESVGNFPPEPFKREFDNEEPLGGVRSLVSEKVTRNFENREKLKNSKAKSQREWEQNYLEEVKKQEDKLMGTKGIQVGESLAIDYIYFGDILNSALGMVRENAKARDAIHRNLGFLVGDVPIITGNQYNKEDPVQFRRQKINIADLPIALDFFTQWFIEAIIKPQRTSYYLRDFIKDILNYLLPAAMYDNAFEESAHKLNVSATLDLSMTTFAIPGTGFKGQERAIYHGERIQNANAVLRDRIQPIRKSLHVEKMKNWGIHDYLYIHANSWVPTDLDGNEEEDFERGIYHFFIGQDSGILHEINFNKVDHKYQRESLITQNGLSQLEYLREPYAAKMRLLGNFLFYPGQLFYVDPKLGGFGDPVKKRSAARQIGLGGYYNVISVEGVISPEGFETDVDGIWVAFASESDAEILDDFKTNPSLENFGRVLANPFQKGIKKTGLSK